MVYILFQSIQNDLENIVEDLKAKLKDNNVDFTSSFQKLVKNHLRIFIRHVFADNSSSHDEDDWGSNFFQKIKDFRNQSISLFRVCFQDANKTMTDYFILKFEEMILPSNNQILRNSLEIYLRNQLLETISSVSLETTYIEKYIVLKSSSSSAAANASAAASINKIEPAITSSIISSSNDDEITNALPLDWIPIVSADIQSQAQLKPQRHGFSDAYSFGMPPKRRKIVKNFENNDASDGIFKNVLGKTFKKMNIGNETGELIIDSLSRNKNLLELFSSKLDTVLVDRLNKDDDFNKIMSTSEDQVNSDKSSLKKKNNEEKKLEFTRRRNGGKS